MVKKLISCLLLLCILLNTANAVDSSNWSTAKVGYEEFKIPPQYDHPYKNDTTIYQFDENIFIFSIRHVTPLLMDLYGYDLEHYGNMEKIIVANHDVVHFKAYNRYIGDNFSIFWFSSGEEFYYINVKNNELTPEIEEIISNTNDSSYSHEEFYSILNEEYENYKLVNAIESQNYDSRASSGSHSFYSFGTNGFNFGVYHD